MSTDDVPKPNCMNSIFVKRICSTIESAKRDIDLARLQCPTADLLRQRTKINAIPVARSVVAAVDAGMRLPGEEAVLWLPFDRPLTDEDALGLWAMFLAPAVRAAYPARLKGRSGFLDFAGVVRDETGQPLGRDGKPLPIVTTEHIGPDGKTYYGWERTGELATDRDNLDEAQLLEVERRIAADWSDLFALLMETVEEHVPSATPSSDATQGDDVAETVKRLCLLLGEDGGKIMVIVNHPTFSTDQKLRALGTLDKRFRGYKSDDLAEQLRVSPSSIRNSSAWKEWNPKPAKRAKSARK